MSRQPSPNKTHGFGPDIYLRSVREISVDKLRARGIDTLLVDLDNTLVPRDTNVVPEEIAQWCAQLADKGMTVCLVSNNWHERVKRIADELGFSLVSRAVKPLPVAFLRAIKLVGSTRSRSAIVGDQMFTDVLGGKLLGIMTIMVLPLSHSDLPHTLLLRRIERMLLAGRQPQS